MSAAEKKEFVIKHVFTDVMNMNLREYYDGNDQFHLNVPWRIVTYRKDAKRFSIYLICLKRRPDEEDSFIETKTVIRLISATGKSLCKTREYRYGVNLNYFEFPSADIEKYLVDGKLTVEMHVEITKMEGIKSEKLRNFDESAKELSDVVLIVDGEQFYVMKLYLASHSSYFNWLFFGNFDESEKSEITLSGINRWHFQNFLDVIHGEPAIDENTVYGILLCAEIYGSSTAFRRCEEFLLEFSSGPVKYIIDIANRFNIKELKKKWASEIETREEVIPEAITYPKKSSVWKDPICYLNLLVFIFLFLSIIFLFLLMIFKPVR